jgi:hypothetical protein
MTSPPISNPVVSAPMTPAAPSNPFLQGFQQGLQAGAPAAPGLNSVPPPVVSPVQPQLPATPAPSDFPAQTVPASAHVPAFDAPPPVPTEPATAVAHPPVADPGTAYLAGPPTATPIASTAVPAGPLPTYGADIRPAVPAAPAPPPPTAPAGPPPSAPPASAPVNPAAGSAGVTPSVARQPTVVPAPQSPAGAFGEQVAVATAGGAAAGAASAQVTAQARLQRFVDFVARQEPRLRWAAGDRPDDTTVLVTDLAAGWIPPNIDIPLGAELLEPARRRGDIEALLGEVTVTASYAPLHYLPPADDSDSVSASSRARQGPVVEELGWELGQATNWRDGLPRLAHTLAKAAAAGTGVLDSEIELLHEHLTAVGEQVLNSYPGDVDPAALANWQLLAAIDALARTDKIAANYHFAWFQALNRRP